MRWSLRFLPIQTILRFNDCCVAGCRDDEVWDLSRKAEKPSNFWKRDKDSKTCCCWPSNILTGTSCSASSLPSLTFCLTWSEMNGKDEISQARNLVCPCSIGLKQIKTQIKTESYLLSGKCFAFAPWLQLGNSGVVQKWKNSFLRGVSAIRWETRKWKLLIFMWTPVLKANGGGSVFFPWKIGIKSVSVIPFHCGSGAFIHCCIFSERAALPRCVFPAQRDRQWEQSRTGGAVFQEGKDRKDLADAQGVLVWNWGLVKPRDAICVICSTKYFLDHRVDLAEFLPV